ncbi:MAG: T9SS type A sorting domain-containing protein [Bacteroidales bacterium]|nr:T9SS type A sorting domain-containing protein [Bacteroidales bacterium]
MRKITLLLLAIGFAATTSVFSQDEGTRPSENPAFERATATLNPLGNGLDPVVIDGIADENFWAEIEPMNLQFDVTNAWWTEGVLAIDPEIKSSGDYNATWKMTMDGEYFYLYAEIIDDQLVKRSAVTSDPAWENDNIELFFLFRDESVVMPDWALGQATQWRIWPDTDEMTMDSVTAGGWANDMLTLGDLMGYTTRTVLTENGYNVEARIPLGLIVPSDGAGTYGYEDDQGNWVDIDLSNISDFQFDICFADRDDATAGAGRQYLLQWSAIWNRDWGFTEGYGIVTVGENIGIDCPTVEIRPGEDCDFERATATINPLSEGTSVNIDGKADEGFWNKIAPMSLQYDVTNAWWVEGVADIDPSIASSGDYDVSYKVTLDDEFFYLFAEITDDQLVKRSAVTSDPAWENDNIELFFLFRDESVVMPDWALGQATQWRIWPDTDEMTMDSVTAGGWANDMLTLGDKMGYNTHTVITDKGYNVEAQIPLGLIVPSDGAGSYGYEDDGGNWVDIDLGNISNFQFDICCADRDDATAGAGRKYLHQWSATWNRDWGFTEGYGILNVGAAIVTSVRGSESINDAINLYPNPVEDMLIINNLRGSNQVKVYDLVGKEVYSAGIKQEGQVELNVNELKTGVYMISIQNENGSRSVKKFIKK